MDILNSYTEYLYQSDMPKGIAAYVSIQPSQSILK